VIKIYHMFEQKGRHNQNMSCQLFCFLGLLTTISRSKQLLLYYCCIKLFLFFKRKKN